MPDSRKKPKTKKGKGKEALQPVPLEEIRDEMPVSIPSAEPRAEPPIARELRAELWSGENPVRYADMGQIDRGGPCADMAPELIDAILSELQPTFWLELGAKLGGAAIVTSERIKNARLETAICCVDSFTGDVDAWLEEKGERDRGEWRYLHLTAGRPSAYERFLANIQDAGHAEIVVPLPCTSLVAMRLIRVLVDEGRLSRVPEVISLDAAHEPDETLLELQRAWSLLEPGGVLFGDNWSLSSVRNEIRTFARTVEADTTRMVAFLRRFEESYLDGNVFLYRGQWVLFRG